MGFLPTPADDEEASLESSLAALDATPATLSTTPAAEEITSQPAPLTSPLPGPAAAQKIWRNSLWFGLETILETLVFLISSVAVARYLGPQKLGYFSFINFFVSVITRTGGVGLALATRKYMSEFLALDKPGHARAVYHFAYRYQLAGSILITALGIAALLLFGDPGYKLFGCILILSIVPGVMSWVPAQANNAFEDARKNTSSAMGYFVAYAIVIVLAIHFRWDLVGIASASLVARTVEVLLRTGPLHKRLRALPVVALDKATRTRVARFCTEAIGIQLLLCLVWDRSEMLFLRYFSTLEQIAFYSISFSLANYLLVIPRTFSSAAGFTLMVESSRDRERVGALVSSSCRYLLLVVFPVNLGAAAITHQVIRLTYGAKYIGAIPVMLIASVLAIPRAFQEIPDLLLRAADKQRQLFFWLGVTGVVNVLLDFAFIPHLGAVGAAWGNGLAQAFGIVVIWKKAQQSFPFRFPVSTAIRLGLAGLVMAAAAVAVGRALPGAPGMIAAILVAGPVYLLFVRLFHGLNPADRSRLDTIGNRFPGPARRGFARMIAFVTAAPVAAEPSQA